MRLQKRVLVSGLAALLGVMVILMVGCSDDDGTTGPTTVNGQMDDPMFVAVKGQLDQFVDSTVSFLKSGLNTMDGVSDGNTILPPQYAVIPEEQNHWDTSFTGDGWYQISIGFSHDVAPVWYASLNDSIQYRLNGEVLMSDFRTRDELQYIHHWTFGVEDTNESYVSFEGDADFTFADLKTSPATITGTRDLDVHVQQVTADSTVTFDFTFAADVDDIRLQKTENTGWSQCPVAGAVSAEITMVYQKDDSEPITTVWNATLTFDHGDLAATVTLGNTVWRYSGPVCVLPQ